MRGDVGQKSIALHREKRGKLGTSVRVDCASSEGLSLAYTPGVAAVCREISQAPDAAYDLTLKWNSVAVLSDGTRVLGLGNIGPHAAIPVMEGKAALFKSYGAIDAWPLCLSCHSVDEIVAVAKAVAPVFGGINLEDIESPKCFEIEDRLKEELDIPVFHDDQHGTGVVALAGLLNSLLLVGKKKKQAKIVIGGAGAAGFGITKMLIEDDFENIVVCDSKGILHGNGNHSPYKRELAAMTNRDGQQGTLADALKGADAFIGASAPNALAAEHVKSMAGSPIVFTLSNPVPEIDPAVAKKAGAAIVGTARSDFPNQINNVLGFPGIFRGALLVRATQITEGMKVAAAHALAGVLSEAELSKEMVLPYPFDRRVVPAVSIAVASAAIKDGVARHKMAESGMEEELRSLGLL